MANWEATMVEVSVDYKGQLHCLAKHGPSGARIETDAPTDNQGKGEEFSPTDLVAAALGTCMATVMGIAASKKEIELDGLRINVTKEMSTEPPRQIAKLLVEIFMPGSGRSSGSQDFERSGDGVSGALQHQPGNRGADPVVLAVSRQCRSSRLMFSEKGVTVTLFPR